VLDGDVVGGMDGEAGAPSDAVPLGLTDAELSVDDGVADGDGDLGGSAMAQ
jgi:hypothetical protein